MTQSDVTLFGFRKIKSCSLIAALSEAHASIYAACGGNIECFDYCALSTTVDACVAYFYDNAMNLSNEAGCDSLTAHYWIPVGWGWKIQGCVNENVFNEKIEEMGIVPCVDESVAEAGADAASTALCITADFEQGFGKLFEQAVCSFCDPAHQGSHAALIEKCGTVSYLPPPEHSDS